MRIELSKTDPVDDVNDLNYEEYLFDDKSDKKFLTFIKESLCNCFDFRTVTLGKDAKTLAFSEGDWYLIQDEYEEYLGILNYNSKSLKISIM